MDETGFIQNQNPRKVVISKGSINMWSKCADAYFDMTFVVCVSSPSPRSPSSNNWGDFSWRTTATGQRWSVIFREHVISGSGLLGYLSGRVRKPGTWARFNWRWCIRSFFTGHRRGYLHCAWGGLGAGSTTGWPAG